MKPTLTISPLYFEDIQYPVHNTIDLDPNAYGTVQQALTGLDDNNNEVVLNLTDNMYSLNNCNEANYTATLDLDDVGVNTSNTVTDATPTASTTNVAFTFTTLQNPSYDFCDLFINPFKIGPHANNEGNHMIQYSEDGIKVDCNSNDISYTIINSIGQVIYLGKILNNTLSLPFTNLPKGVYILRIINALRANESLKFTIN